MALHGFDCCCCGESPIKRVQFSPSLRTMLEPMEKTQDEVTAEFARLMMPQEPKLGLIARIRRFFTGSHEKTQKV